MRQVAITLTDVEAHIVLGPLGEAQFQESIRAAKGNEDAQVRAGILSRVVGQIADGLERQAKPDWQERAEFERWATGQ